MTILYALLAWLLAGMALALWLGPRLHNWEDK